MVTKVQPPKVVEQPFRLYQGDPGISLAAGAASQWSDVWTYQVPNGTALIIKPHHTFSTYLYDSTNSAACGDATCRVKIEKRDASKSDILLLYGPSLYLESQEFQEQVKIARMKVPPEGVIINQREFLIISVYDDAVSTHAASYFELRIAKIRRTIGA
jgi:hypothetical protein